MGEISIEPGETEKIVDSPGPDEAYQLDVNNGNVYVSHNPHRTEAEGKLITPDDRGDVSNFQGGNLYAYAPTGATVRINEQSFQLNLFPRRVVERPTDQAAREGSVDSDYGEVTVAAGGTDFVDAYENTTDEPVYLEMVPFSFNDTDAMTDSRPEWQIEATVMVRDADNSVTYAFMLNAGMFPFNPSQPLPIESGGVVRAVVTNSTTNERAFRMGAIVRDNE